MGRSPAMVCAYSRLPNVNTCSSYSRATFSRNSLQWGRRRVCSMGSPRPSWKWKMPCRAEVRSEGGTDVRQVTAAQPGATGGVRAAQPAVPHKRLPLSRSVRGLSPFLQ